MAYDLDFTHKAKEDVVFHKKTGNKAFLKKMLILLEELTEHPFNGTGRPEQLKHSLSGCWSRRINNEHRIVYEVKDNVVLIHSLKGHYLLN